MAIDHPSMHPMARWRQKVESGKERKMLIRGRDVEAPFRMEGEVCVVGSGAGGAVAAGETAVAGRKTILLEEGSYLKGTDFTQREDEMIPRIFQDQGGRTTRDMSISILQGRGVGGSTVHNTCLSFRPERAILERWREEYGVEIGLDDLLPDIERVEKTLRVVEVKPEEVNRNNELFRLGCERLGIPARRPFHNREDCLGCGFCELGCVFDRKRDMLNTYIPMGLAAGMTLCSDFRVERIVHRRGRVLGVRGIVLDTETGTPRHPFEIRAPRVIVAGGAINTPVLLERSGLAGPLTGKTLHLHPSVAVAGFFREKVEGWNGTPQTIYTDHFATFKKNGYGGYFLIPGFAHPAGTASMLPGLGRAHFTLMKRFPHMAVAGVLLHDETCGRVRAGKHGQPQISYWPSGVDQRGLMSGIEQAARILLAAGAQEVLL
ncbi:MAG: hypothetical protein D6812_03830, partial [Deltaproteobacteria bacterium]